MASPILDATINPPDQEGYNYNPGKTYVEVQLEGGQPRIRKDVLGMVHIVQCTFSCNPLQYTRLMGFFRERIQSHTKIFVMNLLIDTPAILPYRCQITGDPPSLKQNYGQLHVVRATLAVLPNPIKSFTIILNNVSSARIIDAGTIDYPGNMSQFPVGREVILTGTSQIVNGALLNLDGRYTMDSAPDGTSRTLLNAATINPGWTALNAGPVQSYNPLGGAAVLVPL